MDSSAAIMTYNCNRLLLWTPTSIEKERHTHSYEQTQTHKWTRYLNRKERYFEIYLFDNIVFFMCRLDYWFLGCVSLQGWVPARQKSTSSPALRRAALSRLGLCYSHLTSTVVFLLCYLKMTFGDQKYFFQTFKEEFSPASKKIFFKKGVLKSTR